MTGRGRKVRAPSNSRLCHEDRDHETYLPTVYCSPQAYSRFPRPHEDQSGARRHQCAPWQGPCSPRSLSPRLSDASRPVRFVDARLTRPAEFDRVFADNQRARTDAFLVMARPNGLGYPRLGLVIGKRILARAVDRNRVKRCARASFRQVFDTLPACDFVVRLLGKPAAGSEVRELEPAMKRAAGRACQKWPEAALSSTTLVPHG